MVVRKCSPIWKPICHETSWRAVGTKTADRERMSWISCCHRSNLTPIMKWMKRLATVQANQSWDNTCRREVTPATPRLCHCDVPMPLAVPADLRRRRCRRTVVAPNCAAGTRLGRWPDSVLSYFVGSQVNSWTPCRLLLTAQELIL